MIVPEEGKSAVKITELLNRRTDLSTFVIHFTKKGKASARRNLESILQDGQIKARNPMGLAKKMDNPKGKTKQTQRVVCFTEVPLEHVYALVANIEDRRVPLSPYGIGFGKMQMRRKGANPVWYVDITPGHDWLTKPVENMRDAADKAGDFHESDIARITPFIETMGTGTKTTGDTYRVEFWWEREWRYVGDFAFSVKEVALGLCPEKEIGHFQDLARDLAGKGRYPPFIDPGWSLERIIAHTSGLAQSDVSPF